MSTAPDTVPHSFAENVLGVLTGTFVVSLGLLFLTTSGAVTGGTAGLALLFVALYSGVRERQARLETGRAGGAVVEGV